MYPEPDSFKPERFLNPDGSLRDDPVLASAFGFGKRICPARHFVDDTLFIVVASLLSVFNITRGKDSASNEYPYIGTGITYAHRFSLVKLRKLEWLTADHLLSAVRTLSDALSFLGIRWQKSSLPPMPSPFELPRRGIK